MQGVEERVIGLEPGQGVRRLSMLGCLRARRWTREAARCRTEGPDCMWTAPWAVQGTLCGCWNAIPERSLFAWTATLRYVFMSCVCRLCCMSGVV